MSQIGCRRFSPSKPNRRTAEAEISPMGKVNRLSFFTPCTDTMRSPSYTAATKNPLCSAGSENRYEGFSSLMPLRCTKIPSCCVCISTVFTMPSVPDSPDGLTVAIFGTVASLRNGKPVAITASSTDTAKVFFSVSIKSARICDSPSA